MSRSIRFVARLAICAVLGFGGVGPVLAQFDPVDEPVPDPLAEAAAAAEFGPEMPGGDALPVVSVLPELVPSTETPAEPAAEPAAQSVPAPAADPVKPDVVAPRTPG
jgi:hypothetical protein